MPASYEILPYGDSAYLIKFDVAGYSEAVTEHIHGLIAVLGKQRNWEELVPGYNSLLAYFCPTTFPPQKAIGELRKALRTSRMPSIRRGKIIDIPVCYGGEYGPDMDNIMQSSGLTKSVVIKRHSRPVYKVCMMGFIPGFTFLSEAPKTLHHPRRESPRNIVPAGSVGIAGWQTGIYGLESPGGWQIIGRTPVKLFDGERETPFLLKAGDRVRFKPIKAGDFHD
ncbi:MAG: 5-oxoprolinase subunit PxpB [Hellea sp.]|nr:5-oxoprolinase subunit PxpB [Hellea sp.]